MSDLISRRALIGKLEKWKFANEERGYDTAKDLVQEMIDLTKEQESAGDGWIPVSSGKLPEDNTRVLVTIKTDKGSVGIEDCWYSGIDKCFKTYVDLEPLPPQIEVLAWQAIPEPYKAESEITNDNNDI